MEKITLVTTVLNEEETIDNFLDSVATQTHKPDEVVIVDGGSKDWTVGKMQRRGISDINLKIFIEPGANRSQGRNFGIKNATGEVIAITDAGCVLDKDWLSEIVKPFADPKVEVVAGYYRGLAKTVFEKCVIPFCLVMPDEINPNNFYPASRSMAIRKEVFWRLGGFPEEYSDNEDFVFADKLAKNKIKSFFAQNAVVGWIPRSNLKDFWKMIFRFARGDAKAGLRKFKVASVFIRYLIMIVLPFVKLSLGFLFLIYIGWSVLKNYRHVKELRALFWLPILQITSDVAVMAGTISGLRLQNKTFKI